jgi:hypothetical protein
MTSIFSEASIAFRRAYGSNANAMTPHLCEYRTFEVEGCRYFAEISSGSSIFNPGESIYGVTIIRTEGDGEPIKMHAYSDCFTSKQEARDYWLNFKNDRLEEAGQ